MSLKIFIFVFKKMKIKDLRIFNFISLVNYDNLLTLKDLKLVFYIFKKIDVHEKNSLNRNLML